MMPNLQPVFKRTTTAAATKKTQNLGSNGKGHFPEHILKGYEILCNIAQLSYEVRKAWPDSSHRSKA